MQKLGEGSAGFEYLHKDPQILRECFGGEPIQGSWSKAECKDNSNQDPTMQEAVDKYFPESETAEQREICRSQISTESATDENLMAEDGQIALHAAVCRGHPAMVKIPLGGANVNKQDARGRTPKALAERHENKRLTDLILSYENRTPDEHRIDLVGPESADNSMSKQIKHRRQAPHPLNTQQKKEPTCSCSSRFNGPIDTEVTKSMKKRVTIHMKLQQDGPSRRQLGKLIILPDSIEELLKIAGKHCFDPINLKLTVYIFSLKIERKTRPSRRIDKPISIF